MVKVKICGITNISDAIASVNSGCDALGFVFYKKSPRYITPKKASHIIRGIPKNVIKIGVFVNSREKIIKEIAKLCKLDILQFHGEESAGFCQKFKNYKIIKAFRIKDRIDWIDILRYKSFAYLFDAFAKSKIGGTGKRFNWDILRRPKNIKQPIFLSGGLNSRNVRRAVEKLHPDWLDVSSSVESHPGKKDRHKLKKFIQAAKSSG